MKYLAGFIMLLSVNAYAAEVFHATNYEVMQNCLAEAKNLPDAAAYVQAI